MQRDPRDTIFILNIKDLEKKLIMIIKQGRSTPGKIQMNDSCKVWNQLSWMK